jgi:hypothetical protein
MADRSDSLSSFPLPAILTLLSAVGGVIWLLPSLDSSRPAIPLGPKSAVIGYQDVDARLWQDPLEAVRSLMSQTDSQSEVVSHRLSALQKQISAYRGSTSPPQILAVMSSGLPYAEDAESRLRARIAVVSGLARAGLRPTDNEHIGVVAVNWWSDLPLQEPSDLGLSLNALKSGDVNNHILYIPYEWWSMRTSQPTVKERNSAATPDVLVLWLREEAFGDHPLRRLSDLMHGLEGDTKRVTEMTLLGPAWSSTLRQMVLETNTPLTETTQSALNQLTMLSPLATTSDAMLRLEVAKPAKQNLSGNWFKELTGLKDFRRTIATDDVTAQVLVNELKLRQLDFGDNCHIALIAEFDTLYGRWLPYSFAAKVAAESEKLAAKPPQPPTSQPSQLVYDSSRWPNCIDRFSYLRGIDGRLPGDSDDKSSGSDSKSTSTSDASGFTPPVSRQPVEATDGHNQSDSLRRLADQIFEMNRQHQLKGEGYFQAIGVLGSDVYDKLQILKALRKKFPSTLFFTTDLDARYSLATELKETHNLIIASPFGLQLRYAKPALALDKADIQDTELQADIPPFRDDYQTSLFMSTLLALNRTAISDSSINAVRTFEIGRHGPIDLSSTDADIHPVPSASSNGFYDIPPWRWCLILLACVLAYVVVCYYLPSGPKSMLPWTWSPTALIFILSLVFVAAIFLILAKFASGPEGEPWALFEGVSIWPTESLRLFASCLAIGFMLDTHNRLKDNEIKLAKTFKVDPPRHTGENMRERELLSPMRKWIYPNETVQPVNVARLWREYQVYGSAVFRIMRVAGLVGLYLAFGAIAIKAIFTAPIFVPGRGNLSYAIDGGCLLFIVLTLFTLNFYVGDAARLCKRFAQNLRAGPTMWPDELAEKTALSRGVEPDDIRGYLAVDFLARRTEAVKPLLYYPFIVLTLMIIARNKYFDNWGWPPALIFVFAAHLSYAIYQYVTLRRAAEGVRFDAIEQLKTRILQVDDKEKRKKLNQTLKDVRNQNSGAFGPLARSPVVGSLLLPFAGLGGWLLIQLFIQPG